jgi:hypothetical protein
METRKSEEKRSIREKEREKWRRGLLHGTGRRPSILQQKSKCDKRKA